MSLWLLHTATGARRRVSGQRGCVVHFSQVIKSGGKTFFWATLDECVIIPEPAE